MSNFYEALRAQYEPKLICPKCGAENIPGKPPDIQMEGVHAGCSPCGHCGHFEIFMRPKGKTT